GGPNCWIVPIDGGAAVNTGVRALLTRHGLSQWQLSDWIPETNQALVSATHGEASNVWRVPISVKTWQVAGDLQPVTFGAGMHQAASGSAAGLVAFESAALTSAIWTLPIDPNQAKVTGEMRPLTQTGSLNISPALSGDEKNLVFLSNRSGHMEVWMRDLVHNTENSVTASPPDKGLPKVNQDGSEVVYNEGGAVFLASVKGGSAEKICEGCGALLDWSPDGENLLLMHRTGTVLLNTVSRKHDVLLKPSKYQTAHASFSPDRRWIAFVMRIAPAKT